jgi:thiol:disulfide interchange protein
VFAKRIINVELVKLYVIHFYMHMVQIDIQKNKGRVMKKLINFMVVVVSIVTVNLFPMDWDREGAISQEHEQRIAQEKQERRLQQEREWQKRRDRQDEADHEQRKGIIFDIKRRKDLQGRD